VTPLGAVSAAVVAHADALGLETSVLMPARTVKHTWVAGGRLVQYQPVEPAARSGLDVVPLFTTYVAYPWLVSAQVTWMAPEPGGVAVTAVGGRGGPAGKLQ